MAETGGAPTAVIKHYRAKQVVVEQGEPVTWLCVVCEGIVAVNFLDETGKEGVVHLTGPTGMLAPTDFFLGRLVHLVSAVTLSKVTVAFIKPQSLWEWIERDEVFAGRLLRRLADQMGVLEQRYARLQTQNATTRSIQIILEMVRLLGAGKPTKSRSPSRPDALRNGAARRDHARDREPSDDATQEGRPSQDFRFTPHYSQPASVEECAQDEVIGHSSKVEMSPGVRPSSLAFSTRRMILPDRVLGRLDTISISRRP